MLDQNYKSIIINISTLPYLLFLEEHSSYENAFEKLEKIHLEKYSNVSEDKLLFYIENDDKVMYSKGKRFRVVTFNKFFPADTQLNIGTHETFKQAEAQLKSASKTFTKENGGYIYDIIDGLKILKEI